jgi:hypothetical protein
MKDFFIEKKKQKTFAHSPLPPDQTGECGVSRDG